MSSPIAGWTDPQKRKSCEIELWDDTPFACTSPRVLAFAVPTRDQGRWLPGDRAQGAASEKGRGQRTKRLTDGLPPADAGPARHISRDRVTLRPAGGHAPSVQQALSARSGGYAMPSSPHATASPSTMQERERSLAANAAANLTVGGKRHTRDIARSTRNAG
jgi:hypothetical protein